MLNVLIKEVSGPTKLERKKSYKLKSKCVNGTVSVTPINMLHKHQLPLSTSCGCMFVYFRNALYTKFLLRYKLATHSHGHGFHLILYSLPYNREGKCLSERKHTHGM